MSTATLSLKLSPADPAAHPGAAIGAWVAEMVLNVGAVLRDARRDAREERARIRAARDAVAVRTLARQYADSDPGFASDLYAAAARHVGSR